MENPYPDLNKFQLNGNLTPKKKNVFAQYLSSNLNDKFFFLIIVNDKFTIMCGPI